MLIFRLYLPQQLLLESYHRSNKTISIHVIPLKISRNIVQVLGYTYTNQFLSFFQIKTSYRILITQKVLSKHCPKIPPFLYFFHFLNLISFEYSIRQRFLTLELNSQQINCLFSMTVIQCLKCISLMPQRCKTCINDLFQHLSHFIFLIFQFLQQTRKIYFKQAQICDVIFPINYQYPSYRIFQVDKDMKPSSKYNITISLFLKARSLFTQAQQQHIQIQNNIMNIITKIIFNVATTFNPLRGKILAGKWQQVFNHQKTHQSQKISLHKSQKSKIKAVEDLRNYIKENTLAQMYLQAGLDNIPKIVIQNYEDQHGVVSLKPRQGICHGYSWEQLIQSFASVCRTPPKFQDVDIIGVPFYALVVDLLNTEHGRFFFSIPQINMHLKKIFDTYGEMLDSPESLKHMNGQEGGWLSPEALKRVNYDDFVCDPTAPNYGFKSWHDWFTREIKPEARPMNEDQNQIVNNSESYPYFNTPYKNVQWKDKFWLKDHRYSLSEMFDVDKSSKQEQQYFKDSFVGGTVYQGFLNPWCYHRWRAPVSGVIEKCYSAGYTYFVGNPDLHSSVADSYIASQPLLSMISARQIYVIKADNPKIGRIAVIEIGMVEVSGIKNMVREGQRINKGDLLGYFRFGGSSHAIIFDRNAANLQFNQSIFDRKLNPKTRIYEPLLQKVRSPLAWVS